MPNTNRWGSAEVEKNYNWAMRRYLFIVALTTIFGLATGAGFAVFNDPSPKYYPLDLIEYEKCLEGTNEVVIRNWAVPRSPSVKWDFKPVLEYCAFLRPKSI